MRNLRWTAPLGVALVTAMGHGCDGGGGGMVTPAQRELLGSPSAVLVPLPDGRLVVEQDGRLVRIDPRRPDDEPRVIGSSGALGRVYAAVPSGEAVLVLAEGGTYVLRESAWVPSPLREALDGTLRGAAQLPTATGIGVGDLWVVTDRSLYRIVDERAERLALDEDLSEAQLAAVRRPEGPALWVRLADRVLEVWRDRTGALRTARLVLPSVPTELVGDATGTGWLVLDGRLHSVGLDRQLVDHGVAVERLLGSSLAREVWIFGRDERWLHADGRLHRALALDVSAEAPLALGLDGSLYEGGSRVRRFAPRPDVTIEGPPDGVLLVTPAQFVLRVEGSPTVEARLDGAPVEVERDPLRVGVDPSALTDGPHELRFEVRFEDGTLPFVARRGFQVVSNATWSVHIQPLYEAECASCHGPEGPALTRLDAREDWVAQAELILMNLEDGRMPLGRPPLTPNDVAYVQAWILAGFPE
jgi:hypothetical protein